MKVSVPFHIVKAYKDGEVSDNIIIGRYDQQELKEKFGKILENQKLTKPVDFTIHWLTDSAIERITEEIKADIKEDN